MTTQDKLADALLAAKYPHIPCAKYDDLLDFHFAVGGEGPLAYEWSDKPHRLVFRLTTELSELRDSIAAIYEMAEKNQRDADRWRHARRLFTIEDYGRYCSKYRLKYSVGYTIGEKSNPCVLVNGDSVFCEVDAYTTRAEEKAVHIAMALNAWDEG